MGTTMTGIIEWTEDATSAVRPELGLPLCPPRWHEDHLNGMLFQTDKEYDFFAAIAGARNRFGKAPLIPARGVPPHLSSPARRYFDDFGEDLAGWLHLSEIERCVAQMAGNGGDRFYTGFEVDIALDLMRLVSAKLTDPHARLVFNIEGP